MWTTDKVLRAIEIYKSYELLWDSSNYDYKNKEKKNNAWEEFARTMDMPRREVEGKLHSLRSQFMRERKRNKMSSDSGGAVRPSTWFAYGPLLFLAKGESTDTSLKQDINQDSQSTNDSVIENIQILESSTVETEMPTQNPEIRTTQRFIRKRPRECNDSYRFSNEIKKRTDEFDIYGQYVASELRHVKSEHGLIMAKYLINNVILDARLGKLDKEVDCVADSSLRDAVKRNLPNFSGKISGAGSHRTQESGENFIIEVKCEQDDDDV